MLKSFFTAEWFPYYFERFDRSDRVAVMSLAEEGAYHRAIRLAWKYGSVPADPRLLAAKIQKRCTVLMAEKILEMFEPMADNPRQMIHPTVEEIREEQERKYLNRVKGGKAAHKQRSKQKTSSITPAELEQYPSHSPAHNRDKREERREKREEKKKEEEKKPRPKKSNPESLKTRPDLNDDDYIEYLTALPENSGVKIRPLFNRMLIWCNRNEETPSRKRLLNWLEKERSDRPIQQNGHQEQRLPTPEEKLAEIERHRLEPKPDPAEFVRRVQETRRDDPNTGRRD